TTCSTRSGNARRCWMLTKDNAKKANPGTGLLTDGVSLLKTTICIDLYKLKVHIFELAVVRRLFHAGPHDVLPLRGEPHGHMGFYHRLVLPHRSADARHTQTPRGAPLAQ